MELRANHTFSLEKIYMFNVSAKPALLCRLTLPIFSSHMAQPILFKSLGTHCLFILEKSML